MSSLKDLTTAKLFSLARIKTNLRLGSSIVSVGVVASTILQTGLNCLRGIYKIISYDVPKLSV